MSLRIHGPTTRGRTHTRRVTISMAVGLVLLFGSAAAAGGPLNERTHLDTDIRLNGASNVCGFEVRGHFEGDQHFAVFYDNTGAIVREVDTFPSFKVTIYAPSTGKSYTSAGPAVLTQYYTNGAAVGSPVTAILTGLLERLPGIGMEGGRFVYNAVVIGYDPAGVPLIRFVSEVSSVGPDLETTIGAARCAAVR
jgi:hypothetical protein